MANRPFTRNTGSLIEGTLQIGNLAVGVTNQDYTLNPGGKQWWDGPQESNAYIIAKDFPSENKGSKIGNIGTVEFWGGDKTTSAFLNTVNTLPTRSGETDFTDINDAYDWLIANGYWSNISDDSSFIFDYRTKIDKILRPPFTGSGITGENMGLVSALYFNPSDDTTYIDAGEQVFYANFGDLDEGLINLHTSASGAQDNSWIPDNSYSAGANSYSYWTDINFFWQNQSTFAWGEYGGRHISPMALDTASNDIYAYSTINTGLGVNNAKLYRFDLSTKTVQNTTDAITVPQEDLIKTGGWPIMSSFDPVNDKLFLFKENEIIAYTGSNLTTTTQSIDLSGFNSSGAGVPCSNLEITICPYENLNSRKGWVILDNSTLVATTESYVAGSPWNTTYPFYDTTCRRPAYNPQNNQFYFTTYTYSRYVYLIIVDGSTGEYLNYVQVQDSSPLINTVFASDLVYDPKRNAIWGINMAKKLFALNCEDDTLYREFQFQDSSKVTNANDTSLALDSTNDLLMWGRASSENKISSFDLNKLWPA
jgi:hypothetical protein